MFTLLVPGKTFIVGEYLALLGESAIIACTSPYFELRVTPTTNATTTSSEFHKDSPAGKFIANNRSFFQAWDLKFVDPYEGAGGLGGSTAEFLASYIFKNHYSEVESHSQLFFDYTKALQDFLAQFEGTNLPSGFDLVAQLNGGVTYFNKSDGVLNQIKWDFADLDFLILKTPFKIKTHEHLKGLDLNSVLVQKQTVLKEIVEATRKSLEESNPELFCKSVNNYYQQMLDADLVLPETKEVISEIQKRAGFKAIKGCGALGADTILVVDTKEKLTSNAGFFADYSLTPIGTVQNLGHGLKIL